MWNPLALHCIQLAQCLFLRQVLVEIRHQNIRRALLAPEHAGNNRPGVQVKVRQHLTVSLQLFLRHARIHQPVGILEQLEVRLVANVGFRHSFDKRVRQRLMLAVRADDKHLQVGDDARFSLRIECGRQDVLLVFLKADDDRCEASICIQTA